METLVSRNIVYFFFQFKSYYVVWKPQRLSRLISEKIGLNRTM